MTRPYRRGRPALCSDCDEPRVSGQRYCKQHRAAYQRDYRAQVRALIAAARIRTRVKQARNRVARIAKSQIVSRETS